MGTKVTDEPDAGLERSWTVKVTDEPNVSLEKSWIMWAEPQV